MRVGLIDVLDALEDDNSDELQTQLKVTPVRSRKYLESFTSFSYSQDFFFRLKVEMMTNKVD